MLLHWTASATGEWYLLNSWSAKSVAGTSVVIKISYSHQLLLLNSFYNDDQDDSSDMKSGIMMTMTMMITKQSTLLFLSTLLLLASRQATPFMMRVLRFNGAISHRIYDFKQNPIQSHTRRLPRALQASTAVGGATNTSPMNKVDLTKRVMTGVSLGVVSTLWIIFGGKHAFCLGFMATALVAQAEYASITLRSGRSNGTMAIQNVFTALCYITATYAPQLHNTVLPLYVSVLMTWLLSRDKPVLLDDISLPLLGLFIVGYLPSFWTLLGLHSSAATTAPLYTCFKGQRSVNISARALLLWWSWCSIVIADVGAFFGGRSWGLHKLGAVSGAAGSASPNKTVEGALVGIAGCTLFFMLGALLLRWPMWPVAGAGYGFILGLLAMIGDLTLSTIKRSAGVKDSGSILPGHGGLLDRIDSYILSAPVAYLFVTVLLPLLERRVG